jgi:hypothetical protein
MRKKKSVISNTGKLFCINNNLSNLYKNSVVEKINGMAYVFTLLMFPRPSPEYSFGKINPLFPIRAASFVSMILYLIHVLTKYEGHCHFSAAVS